MPRGSEVGEVSNLGNQATPLTQQWASTFCKKLQQQADGSNYILNLMSIISSRFPNNMYMCISSCRHVAYHNQDTKFNFVVHGNEHLHRITCLSLYACALSSCVFYSVSSLRLAVKEGLMLICSKASYSKAPDLL